MGHFRPLSTQGHHEDPHSFLLAGLKNEAPLHIKEISKVIKGLPSGDLY